VNLTAQTVSLSNLEGTLSSLNSFWHAIEQIDPACAGDCFANLLADLKSTMPAVDSSSQSPISGDSGPQDLFAQLPAAVSELLQDLPNDTAIDTVSLVNAFAASTTLPSIEWRSSLLAALNGPPASDALATPLAQSSPAAIVVAAYPKSETVLLDPVSRDRLPIDDGIVQQPVRNESVTVTSDLGSAMGLTNGFDGMTTSESPTAHLAVTQSSFSDENRPAEKSDPTASATALAAGATLAMSSRISVPEVQEPVTPLAAATAPASVGAEDNQSSGPVALWESAPPTSAPLPATPSLRLHVAVATYARRREESSRASSIESPFVPATARLPLSETAIPAATTVPVTVVPVTAVPAIASAPQAVAAESVAAAAEPIFAAPAERRADSMALEADRGNLKPSSVPASVVETARTSSLEDGARALPEASTDHPDATLERSPALAVTTSAVVAPVERSAASAVSPAAEKSIVAGNPPVLRDDVPKTAQERGIPDGSRAPVVSVLRHASPTRSDASPSVTPVVAAPIDRHEPAVEVDARTPAIAPEFEAHNQRPVSPSLRSSSGVAKPKIAVGAPGTSVPGIVAASGETKSVANTVNLFAVPTIENLRESFSEEAAALEPLSRLKVSSERPSPAFSAMTPTDGFGFGETLLLRDLMPASTGSLKELPRHSLDQLVSTAVVRADLVAEGTSQRFTMRLDPPSLGEMVIQIHRDSSGAVAVHVSAASPQTHALLEQHGQEISRSLNEQGLSLSNLDLSQQQQQGHSQNHAAASEFQEAARLRSSLMSSSAPAARPVTQTESAINFRA
jgi:hypothetical protein